MIAGRCQWSVISVSPRSSSGEVASRLSLGFHAPDRDLEVAHLRSGSGSNVRTIECPDHWAALGTAHPMRAGIIEGLQTIRAPGSRKRKSGAQFGFNAHKLRRG